jgi:hypothetical protein
MLILLPAAEFPDNFLNTLFDLGELLFHLFLKFGHTRLITMLQNSTQKIYIPRRCSNL